MDDSKQEDAVKNKQEEIRVLAVNKLQDELEQAKDKSFAEPIIGYLLKRCEEDSGLSEDVMIEHKTWEKCLGYIYEKAKKQAVDNCAAVRDDVVFEWAEDYYHKDDKAEEPVKDEKVINTKGKASAAKTTKAKSKKPKKKEVPVKPEQESSVLIASEQQDKSKIKKSHEIPGQMDLFSLMGI